MEGQVVMAGDDTVRDDLPGMWEHADLEGGWADTEDGPAGDDLLAKTDHDGGQFRCEPFSEAADRINYAISSVPLPWIDCYGEAERHDRHIWNDACSICKAGYAPHALRVVIDAVLNAALSDPAVRDALAAALQRPLRPAPLDDLEVRE